MPHRNPKSAKRHHRVLSKKRRSMRRKRGGGCGCGAGGVSMLNMPSPAASQVSSILMGGSPTPGLSQLPGMHYYPLDTKNFDPNYSSVAGRLTDNYIVKGGSSRRRRASHKVWRKKNGGGAMDLILGKPFFNEPWQRYTQLNPPLA